ncbi:SPX domain-containing protein [Mycena amicta]|nr:SPX domain-containing protein [Mycena amicta]
MNMKFTRYLEDTQIPEWKRAYIDYRLFKERLRAIRQAAQDGSLYPFQSYSNSQLDHQAEPSMLSVIKSESGENSSGESLSLNLPMDRRDLTFVPNPPRLRVDGPSTHTPTAPDRRPSIHRTLTQQSNAPPPSPGGVPAANVARNPRIMLPQLIVRQPTSRSQPGPPSPGGETVTTGGRLARMNSNHLSRQWTNTSQARPPVSPGAAPSSPASRIFKNVSQILDPLRKHPYATLSMHALLPLLSPQELAFFIALDEQVSKVETFYQDRQKMMKAKSRELELQLRELDEHRRLFDAANSEPSATWASILSPWVAWLGLPFASKIEASRKVPPNEDIKAHDEYMEGVRFDGHLDPEKYGAARRKLKKAVMEHYRGIGLLNNYRILNIYAIQRVLAKFEKTTKVSVNWSLRSLVSQNPRFLHNAHTWTRRSNGVSFTRMIVSGR